MNEQAHNIDALKKKISSLEAQLDGVRQDYNSLLDKTNQNLKDLFDNSNDLITIFRATGEIRFANESVKKKLAYTEDEITKLKFIEVVHEDHRSQALQNILKISEGSGFVKFDTVLFSKTGKNVYVTGKLTSVFENGKPVEYQCLFYDISERIRAESAQSLYYQIANITITENDLEQLYANIYEQLSQMLRVRNLQISLKTKSGYKKLFFVNELEKEYDFVFDVDTMLMDYTFERGRSLIIYEEGIQKIAGQKRKQLKDPTPKIWLGVLISTPNEKGVMSVFSYTDQSAFNNKDLELLDYIVGQISLAMERQHKEEKIENQAATLGAIFDSSTHEIWSLDRKLNFTSFNQNYEKAYEKYYGVKPRIGSCIKDVPESDLMEDYLTFSNEKYEEAFKGQFVNFQTKNKNREGKMIWREVFVNPIFLPNGKIEELSVIANDITEKKESESALIASEEKFRSIFESFQDIYFRCDMEGIVTMVSPSIQEVLGYEAKDIVGTNIMQYVVNKRQVFEMANRIDKEKRIRNIEQSVLNSKGLRNFFLFNIRLIQREDGKDEVEGVAIDISQLKKTNEELIRAKDEAERSLKIKERFLANMSHEIRTPMNGIIGMIDLLASTLLDSEQFDYVKTLSKSSQTLLNILNDILDLSKIEAGKIEIRRRPVNLVKTIEKVYDLFSKQASSKNNHLYYHIDQNTPSWVMADETRLIQILSNLASNSIKFSKQKGHINISLRLLETQGSTHHFKVSIKDSGIGISERDQKTLFQSFHQLDNSSSKNFGGTGLGLAISKELVKSMGGDIGIVSTPGLGSTFWFTFPAEKTHVENFKDETNQDIQLIRQFTEQKPKILLVDDNDINRKVASIILTKSGCSIVQASNGFEAIETAKKDTFDLVLMDIQMPQMDGIESAKKIRMLNLHPNQPIIAMTAYSMEEDRERFLKAGMDDYLSKPIKANSLIAKVKEWIDFEPWQVASEAMIDQNEDLVINQNTLNQLAKFGGQELIKETLHDFEIESEEILQKSIQYFNDSNFEKLRGELHTLKGNAGTLGVEKVSKQASFIEKNLKENKFGGLNKHLEVLRLFLKEFKESSNNLLINDE